MINAEPHIVMRMKRVFAKIAKDNVKISLDDTNENCRDLLWFLDRYPLEISAENLKRLKRGSKDFNEKILTLEKILSGNYDTKPVSMVIPPRVYQQQAAALWLANGFLLLADDLGAGKSASAICGLTDPRTRPSLVCTLAHLTTQWRNELNKFTPHLRSHILKSTMPYELPKVNGKKPDVLICNYHKLSGWQSTLAGEIKSVVFDEGQELRCGDSMKYDAATTIARKAKYNIALTGTPVYNNGSEMYNLLHVLKEDCLGSRTEFDREWVGQKGRVVDPKAFGTYLREQGLMLRRTRSDIGRELPPITHIPYEVDADPEALEKVKGSASQLAKLILSEAPGQRGQRFTAAGKFDVIMRQATGIAKAPYVADFVKILIESGERVVLFAWHRAVYDILMEQLAEFKPAMYTGEESAAQKDEAKRRFIDKETPLIIISLRAGAGIDGLQHVCRTVVFGELDYSDGVHRQCCGRVFRDGQKDPVSAYYMNSTMGTDPLMVDILGIKKQQIEGINDPKKDIIEKVTNTTDHVYKLARHYLASIGESLRPEDEDF